MFIAQKKIRLSRSTYKVNSSKDFKPKRRPSNNLDIILQDVLKTYMILIMLSMHAYQIMSRSPWRFSEASDFMGHL